MASTYGADTIVSRGLEMNVDVLDVDSYPGSGTTVTEVVSGAEGTLTNSSISTSPTAHMVFDGSGYLQLSGHRPTTLHTNSNTLEIWFQNNTGGSYEGIFSEGVPIQVYALLNRIEVYLRKPGESGGSYFISGATTGTIGSDGDWTLLHLVRDVTEFKYFINGVLVKTITGITATDVVESSVGRQDTLIGVYATGTYRYTGGIGPVRQYNRALSAGEILHNFNALRDRFGV